MVLKEQGLKREMKVIGSEKKTIAWIDQDAEMEYKEKGKATYSGFNDDIHSGNKGEWREFGRLTFENGNDTIKYSVMFDEVTYKETKDTSK